MPDEHKKSDSKGGVASVAKHIQSMKYRDIIVMLGAGISTSAGIPDFRSPKTGLYANLARLKLPFPEAVFEINFFRNNPIPFYTLAKEMQPSQFRPTLTHSFIRLLADKQLLHTCLTQNIDTLERRAGVPADLIIEAHGSFATQRCIDCRRPYGDADMHAAIMGQKIPRCERCEGLVKPDIVFFGESLPEAFHRVIPKLREADLLIVMGTSLTVQPFASLAERVPEDCPRVLINLNAVGHFGSRKDDVILLGKCDDVIRQLAQELGWEEELDKAWEATASCVESKKVESPVTASQSADEKTKEKERLQAEVEKLTDKVEKSLAIAGKSTAEKKDTWVSRLMKKRESKVASTGEADKIEAPDTDSSKIQLEERS